jgi:hypothetical protein
VVVALATALAAASAREPTLDEVLDRLGVYVLDYEDDLASVVAEEQYQQSVHGATSSASPQAARRSLISDFAFTRPADGAPWTGFRDTFQVDGRPVRDRDARLERLLADRSQDGLQQAARIVEENARFNLASNLVRRTINSPTLTVDFLHPRHRGRFTFRRGSDDRVDGRPVWKIDFTEHGWPPLVQTPGGFEQVTRGTAWVDPDNGAIVRTSLQVVPRPDGLGQARVTVTFGRDAKLGLLVPSEMREAYAIGRGNQIDGVATYSRFRRFETSGRIVEQ